MLKTFKLIYTFCAYKIQECVPYGIIYIDVRQLSEVRARRMD